MWNRIRRKMRSDSRGFTLIELILAVAIAGILIGAITFFLMMGSRAYESAKNEIDLQAEAQIVMNQLRDRILESNCMDAYAATSNQFTLYYIEENPKATEEKDKQRITRKEVFWLDTAEKRLYYRELKDDDIEINGNLFPEGGREQYLLAEYVKSMNIQQKKAMVEISLVLEDGSRQYTLENSIKLRNRLLTKPA